MKADIAVRSMSASISFWMDFIAPRTNSMVIGSALVSAEESSKVRAAEMSFIASLQRAGLSMRL